MITARVGLVFRRPASLPLFHFIYDSFMFCPCRTIYYLLALYSFIHFCMHFTHPFIRARRPDLQGRSIYGPNSSRPDRRPALLLSNIPRPAALGSKTTQAPGNPCDTCVFLPGIRSIRASSLNKDKLLRVTHTLQRRSVHFEKNKHSFGNFPRSRPSCSAEKIVLACGRATERCRFFRVLESELAGPGILTTEKL